IVFEPTIIADLSPVSAEHLSPRGPIRAGWTADGESMRYQVEIPQGSRGLLRLPADYRDIAVDGAGWNGQGDLPLSAGAHTITFSYTSPPRKPRAEYSINARTP